MNCFGKTIFFIWLSEFAPETKLEQQNMFEDTKYSNKKSDSDRACASVECDPRGHRPRHINPSDGDAKPQLAGDSHALLTFFTPRKTKSTISLACW